MKKIEWRIMDYVFSGTEAFVDLEMNAKMNTRKSQPAISKNIALIINEISIIITRTKILYKEEVW